MMSEAEGRVAIRVVLALGFVFAFAQFAEDFSGAAVFHPHAGGNGRFIRAQKYVGLFLFAKQRRDRRLVLAPQALYFLGAGFQRCIVGLDREREFDVGCGVFMAAIEFEVIRHRPQLIENKVSAANSVFSMSKT